MITIGRIQQSRAPFPARPRLPAPYPSRSANSPRPEPRSLAHARAALRSGSRKNATYAAFREVGRVIRTVQLLRYLSDAPLRRRVTAPTNKVESFNRFSQWIGFGNRGVIAGNDPIEQETRRRPHPAPRPGPSRRRLRHGRLTAPPEGLRHAR
ncbi:Tn3 family transposase [Streptomyces sp. NPDC059742]|uniref:Tn3 family transposase n=1 Tax=Streptomyces sp. NPDC059742 TaxID=3346927 RepID=UPI0036611E28